MAAPDRELNAWASLKKIVRRRPEHIERNEVNIYKKKANNIHIKKKILPTVYAELVFVFFIFKRVGEYFLM